MGKILRMEGRRVDKWGANEIGIDYRQPVTLRHLVSWWWVESMDYLRGFVPWFELLHLFRLLFELLPSS